MQKYRTDIFTPPTIAKKIIEQHKQFSTNINNVLEPSAGIGNLIDVMLSVYKQIDAYEINEKYIKTLQKNILGQQYKFGIKISQKLHQINTMIIS